jgi:hypothetical protein
MTHRTLVVWFAYVVFVCARPLVAAPLDPCTLLTSAQASAALGATVPAGKPLAPTVCEWREEGKVGTAALRLDITVITPERFAQTKSATVGTVTNVSGVGNDAYYSTIPSGATISTGLSVKKGDTAVVIRVMGGHKAVEEYQAKEKAVAQTILPKL